jgi:hypothetical protein
MIIIKCNRDAYLFMRVAVLTLMTLALFVLVADNAFAAQFAFDPRSGMGSKQLGSLIPVAIIAVALLLGAILIALERKKAKGIWFSNSERLKLEQRLFHVRTAFAASCSFDFLSARKADILYFDPATRIPSASHLIAKAE